ncbi:MAG: cytidine deaminase [Haliscomenobacteraceae bacterium CHB4]|nr:Cytidine deaminase [Saprospiraceae bacterium]MCE7924257.1 cytidine deaminase [Haliscomenobacteraceae bacterium CHB4]
MFKPRDIYADILTFLPDKRFSVITGARQTGNRLKMKEQTLRTTYNIYDSEAELSPEDRALLTHARLALENSYSPYSNFKVGAAVRMANGEIFGGSNYENAAYPLCICAEQSVLSSAASRYPGISVVGLAVTVRSPHKVLNEPAAPCGGCRQVICETEQRNGQAIRIILQGEKGPVYVFEKGGDLLPMAFGAEDL